MEEENVAVEENVVVEPAQVEEPVQNKGRVFTRDSNIELLRIVCMIFIIAHHFACHSGFTFAPEDLTFNRFLYDFFYSGGKIGVDVFVLITGYFMCRSDRFKFDRILKLWLQLFTVNLIIFVVMVLCGREEFSWMALLENMLPVTFEKAWFVSAFFVLTLLIPPLNTMIKHFTQKRHLIMIIIGTILWCIVPTFIFGKTYFFSNWEYNSIIWFMYLYVVGAYISKYGLTKTDFKGSTYILISLAIYVVTLGITVLFGFLSKDNSYLFENERALFEMQTLPVIAISVLLLVGFSKIKLGTNKVINFISATTFGIYLIHDNILMRPIIWGDILKCATYQDSNMMILIGILGVIAVFIGCSIIEIIRQFTIELLYKKPIEKLGALIDRKIKSSMPDKQITK